jgi:hypothetical protein
MIYLFWTMLFRRFACAFLTVATLIQIQPIIGFTNPPYRACIGARVCHEVGPTKMRSSSSNQEMGSVENFGLLRGIDAKSAQYDTNNLK